MSTSSVDAPPTISSTNSVDLAVPRGDVCKVGYALNAKKLRKSGAGSIFQTHEKKSLKLGPHACWQGGGLSDILQFNVTGDGDSETCEGVQFLPWNWELPMDQQV